VLRVDTIMETGQKSQAIGEEAVDKFVEKAEGES